MNFSVHTLPDLGVYSVTSKTRVIPPTLMAYKKLYFWCSLVEGKAKFGERATQRLGKNSTSHLF